MLNRMGPGNSSQVNWLRPTSSSAMSQSPSRTSRGKPFPAPGSTQPKKYSASPNRGISGSVNRMPVLSTPVSGPNNTLRNTGPQVPDRASRERTWTRIGASTLRFCSNSTCSSAWSQLPSTAPMGHPFPSPGSSPIKTSASAKRAEDTDPTMPPVESTSMAEDGAKTTFRNTGPHCPPSVPPLTRM